MKAVSLEALQLRAARQATHPQDAAQREVAACHVWLEQELAAVRPSVIVALGATAVGAVMGRRITITEARATPALRNAEGVRVVATYHPSAVLRAPDEDRRQELYGFLVADLRRAARDARLTRTSMQRRKLRTHRLMKWRRSPSAATCSAGPRTRRRRSRSSTRSWRRGSISSTPPIRTRVGSRGTRAASRKRPSGAGSPGAGTTKTWSSRRRSARTWASATSA